MINVVIGQSGIGKTTFVKNRWGQGKFEIKYDQPVPYTLFESGVLLGKYNVGIRTEGTDTLSYSAIPKILDTIDALYPLYNIGVEGDRINNSRFFQHLISKNYSVKLYFLDGDLSISYKRLRNAGSNISESFIKTTKTKSSNNFLKYGGFFKGVRICVE